LVEVWIAIAEVLHDITLANLTVNNASCGWAASNCRGQNLSGPPYLFVYVGKWLGVVAGGSDCHM